MYSLHHSTLLLICLVSPLPLAAQVPVKRVPKHFPAHSQPHELQSQFDGAVGHDYIPPPRAPFPDPIYNGGALVAHASYTMVYWGSYWTSGLGLAQRHHFNDFVSTVAGAPGF